MKKTTKSEIIAIIIAAVMIIVGCLIGGFFGGLLTGSSSLLLSTFTIGKLVYNRTKIRIDALQQRIFNLQNDIRDGNIN